MLAHSLKADRLHHRLQLLPVFLLPGLRSLCIALPQSWQSFWPARVQQTGRQRLRPSSILQPLQSRAGATRCNAPHSRIEGKRMPHIHLRPQERTMMTGMAGNCFDRRWEPGPDRTACSRFDLPWEHGPHRRPHRSPRLAIRSRWDNPGSQAHSRLEFVQADKEAYRRQARPQTY